ncbi:MAG: hypothetical protein OXN89_11745 [Bryobacterales bacterium]|nr:hypothetical protein [Bryobacterales bacterium]
MEAMKMTRALTSRDSDADDAARRITWRTRAFVLGGLALAAVCTVVPRALGAGAEHVGPLWMAAIAWTLAANLAGALWRGFRHHDWSAFSWYELPEDDGDMHDWSSRTGRYSSLGEMEDQLLRKDDHLR